MAELPRCRLVRWEEIDRWAQGLAEKVRRAGHLPDAIVGLTRGGWVPARLTADRLGVKRLLALQTAHWGVTATRSGKAEITDTLSGPVDGSVLVVDDITDTGESLKIAVEHVREIGRPSRLESGTLLHIGHSTYRPTYFAEEIPEDRWVWFVFPWTYWEDLRTLARQALPDGGDAAGVARVLMTESGLRVSPHDIERALREDPATARA
jgi:hypoxanthine phosphoribosyltransferase